MEISDEISIVKDIPLLEINVEGKIDLTELTARINQGCQQAEEQHAMLCVTLTGCSYNIADLDYRAISIQDINRWEQAVRRMERFSKIVIVSVSGALSGPAFDVFLSADYRIATSDVAFVMPTNQAQIWPGMMIHRLVHQIGMARCRQLLIGKHDFTAEEALDLGLLDEISNDVERIAAVASRLSSMSNKGFSIRRQLMMEAVTVSFEEALGAHLAACDRELRRLGGWKPQDPRGYDT